MCIFLLSLNLEHNLEDYVWDCKCILTHTSLHLLVPTDIPQVQLRGGMLAQPNRYRPQSPPSEKCSLRDPAIGHKMQLADDERYVASRGV